jgi:chloramphenicol 3-O-phosphotransferase
MDNLLVPVVVSSEEEEERKERKERREEGRKEGRTWRTEGQSEYWKEACWNEREEEKDRNRVTKKGMTHRNEECRRG